MTNVNEMDLDVDVDDGFDRDFNERDQWQPLYYFNIYRLILAGILLVSVLTKDKFGILDSKFPLLTLIATVAIAVSCIVNFYTISVTKPRYIIQANYQIGIDILLLALLIFAGNGVNGSLVILLVVSIAAAAVLLSTKMTLFYSGFAFALLLAQQVLASMGSADLLNNILRVGVFGAAIFTTGLVIRTVAQRIQASGAQAEALAEQRGVDIKHLDQINRGIVDRLELGVFFIDQDNVIQTVNDKTRELFGTNKKYEGIALPGISPQLYDMARQFGTGPDAHLAQIQPDPDGPTLQPSIQAIGDNRVIYLENVSEAKQRTEDAKLAALGRLAAAIAHEVRNPLGAISHAEQLLRESPNFSDEDKSLLVIIDEQTKRINTVIESILKLSRYSSGNTVFGIRTWLISFRDAFVHSIGLPKTAVKVDGPDVKIDMNADHLNQVITNLCVNAVRHSPPFSAQPVIRMLIRVPVDGSNPTLDVMDTGEGIPPENAEMIFEPFFTSSPAGIGLGLFIARQLCEANNARLDLVPSQGETRFRVTLPSARDQDDEFDT